MRPISLSDENLGQFDQEEMNEFENTTNHGDGLNKRKGEIFIDSLFDELPDEDEDEYEDEDAATADYIEDYSYE